MKLQPEHRNNFKPLINSNQTYLTLPARVSRIIIFPVLSVIDRIIQNKLDTHMESSIKSRSQPKQWDLKPDHLVRGAWIVVHERDNLTRLIIAYFKFDL